MRVPAALVVLILGAAPLLGGCDSAETFSIGPYLGEYVGTRTVTFGDETDEPENVTYIISAVEAERTVLISLRFEGSPELVSYTGTYDENGIEVDVEGGGGALQYTVDLDGDISGTIEAFGASGTVMGRLTPDQFDFIVRSALEDDPDSVVLTEIRTRRR